MLFCQDEEFYLSIFSSRGFDTILFHHEGGVDIGNVDEKANKITVSKDLFDISTLSSFTLHQGELLASSTLEKDIKQL